jgi:hypothetical protein
VRFPESSAEIEGNLVDGAISARNGAMMHLGDNLATPTALLYLGYHPLRQLYAAPADFGFTWREAAPRRAAAAPSADLCGIARKDAQRYGAFEDFAACLAPRR